MRFSYDHCLFFLIQVAFLMVQIVDSGKTLVMVAGSTKTGHKNQSYQAQLWYFLTVDLADEMSKYGEVYDVIATGVYARNALRSTSMYGLPIMFWRVNVLFTATLF